MRAQTSEYVCYRLFLGASHEVHVSLNNKINICVVVLLSPTSLIESQNSPVTYVVKNHCYLTLYMRKKRLSKVGYLTVKTTQPKETKLYEEGLLTPERVSAVE